MISAHAQVAVAAATEAAPQTATGVRSGTPLGTAPDVADSEALSPAQWQFASAQRAALYGWFSRLYAQEVSKDLYLSHFADGGFAPLAGLAELGLEAEVQRLDAAIATLRAEQLPRLELAADFAQLFLLDGKTSALPYASAYEGKDAASPLYGAAEARMRGFLAARALALQADFREPADHLAVPLALMAELAERAATAPAPSNQTPTGATTDTITSAARAQADFLRTAVLDWLPRFVERCQQARPRFDVYPALATLLLGFVRADVLFLDDVVGSARADAA